MAWLFGDRDHRDHPVSGFLFKLDEFNLNDYIKAIHFDELKVPSAPFQMPNIEDVLRPGPDDGKRA